jgi:hypothetical protein
MARIRKIATHKSIQSSSSMASISPLETLLEGTLKRQGEDVATSSVAGSCEVVALYFSASW